MLSNVNPQPYFLAAGLALTGAGAGGGGGGVLARATSPGDTFLARGAVSFVSLSLLVLSLDMAVRSLRHKLVSRV